MANNSLKLFQPIALGAMALRHRVVLAPLTRLRADANHVPSPLAKVYYGQRASEPGTFLLSESTFVAAKAGGFPGMPGIYSDEQVTAWKTITEEVHAKGSYISCQLVALGRVAFRSVLEKEGPFPYVAPSPIKLSDRESDPAPRELSIAELAEYTDLYVKAAVNAVEKAGFDAVEVHCANGSLLDQFLQDTANRRTDIYGGSVENRVRFPLEIVEAVVKAVGAKRVAVRIGPWTTTQDMGMADPIPTFAYFVEQLRDRYPALLYLHVIEPRVDDSETQPAAPPGQSNDFVRAAWAPRPLISADGYTRELAIKVAENDGELVAFGRAFIGNPDLPYRLRNNIPLTESDRNTYYAYKQGPEEGYTDYPFAEKI